MVSLLIIGLSIIGVAICMAVSVAAAFHGDYDKANYFLLLVGANALGLRAST